MTDDLDRGTRSSAVAASANGSGPRSFRPASRRRTRIALGAALVAVAVGGNLLLYTGLDSRTAVLQVVRDVPAGTRIDADDLRTVDVSADPTVRTVDADAIGTVVGSYARVRLVAGSLVVSEALQPEPLVSPGAAVVAVQVPEGALPSGLRERSQVRLVVPPSRGADGEPPTVVDGRTVGLPTAPQSVSGRVSLSVEVDEAQAPAIAASDDVRVVLVDPGVDPAAGPVANAVADARDEGSDP